MKKVRVRKATPRDKGLFRKLWADYLDHQHKAGSFVLANDHNLSVFEGIFDLYTQELQPGIVLFIAEDAVLMWGKSSDDLIETNLGTIAQGWGTYIKPESRGNGLSKSIREEGKRLLKEMGFDAVIGTGLINEETSLNSAFEHGWDRHSVLGICKLKEVEE